MPKCSYVLAVAIVVLTGPSCGSSPTGPSSLSLPGPGSYWLDITGFASPADPPSLCNAPITTPTRITITVDISTEEDGQWVARSLSVLGDLELRIHDRRLVSGSIRGTSMDTSAITWLVRSAPLPSSLPRIRIGVANGSAALVIGSAEQLRQNVIPASTGNTVLGGTFFGDIEYFTSLGDVTKCPSVIWGLRPELR